MDNKKQSNAEKIILLIVMVMMMVVKVMMMVIKWCSQDAVIWMGRWKEKYCREDNLDDCDDNDDIGKGDDDGGKGDDDGDQIMLSRCSDMNGEMKRKVMQRWISYFGAPPLLLPPLGCNGEDGDDDGDFFFDDENGDNERNVNDMMVNMMVKAVVSRFLPKGCYSHHQLWETALH